MVVSLWLKIAFWMLLDQRMNIAPITEKSDTNTVSLFMQACLTC